jgi:type IV pilus assembly protein PilA
MGRPSCIKPWGWPVVRQDQHGGFTLIELMIVILIIAILVAIAVPVMIASGSNAQRRTCQANLRTIDGAINTYDAL